jgi:hypothetical protein
VAVRANNKAVLVAAMDAANAFPSTAQPSLVDHYVDLALRSSHQVDGPPLVALGMQGSRTPLLICLCAISLLLQHTSCLGGNPPYSSILVPTYMGLATKLKRCFSGNI